MGGVASDEGDRGGQYLARRRTASSCRAVVANVERIS